jgi:hypothetical protein
MRQPSTTAKVQALLVMWRFFPGLLLACDAFLELRFLFYAAPVVCENRVHGSFWALASSHTPYRVVWMQPGRDLSLSN